MPSPPGMKENLTSCVSPHQKDPMSNGCLSTLLVKKKKMILHIFCTSLTVSIEPGPCGFAEGSRGVTSARTQPRPREGGGKARGRRSSNRAGAGSEGRGACGSLKAKVPPPPPPPPGLRQHHLPARVPGAPDQRLGLQGAPAPPAREGAASP